jgi:hypothetical protein
MDQPSQLAADAPRLWARPLVLVPIFALISLVGALFPSFSVGANLLILASGGTLFWLGLSDRLPRRGSPPQLAGRAGWWLLPALLLAFIELTNFALGSTYAHPTLSLLADPVLEDYLARAAAYFAWLMAYWGLVRR